MLRTTIILNVHGGLVQDVFCSDPNAHVQIVDWDQENDPEAPRLVEVEMGRRKLAFVGGLLPNPLCDLAGTDSPTAIGVVSPWPDDSSVGSGSVSNPQSQPPPNTRTPNMPGLTVTEKEHWKERISRRIDKRIEAICAVEPNLMDRIDREARERALDSLGLAALQRELDENERQKEALEKREKELCKAMLAHVRGVPAASLDGACTYGFDSEVERAVTNRQAVHEDELLAENETGQKILALRREKDDLLDTVWLACSIGQVKQLWQRVGDLLGDQPTKLQSQALAIEPVSEA